MTTTAALPLWCACGDAHITHCHQFIAPNDDDALEHARQFVNGYDVELWNGGRIVAKFKKGAVTRFE